MKSACLYFLIVLLCFNLVACGSENASDNTIATESQVVESTDDDSLPKKDRGVEELVLESKENLQQYIDLLGAKSEGDMEVTQDFLDNINAVKVMGIAGSVSHGFSESSISEIDIMDWISNETVSVDEFESFTTQLNYYFDYTAEIKSYDNISEKTYVWVDYANCCMVLGWYEDERINIRWNYEVDYVNSLVDNSATQQDEDLDITIECEVDDCNKEGTFDIVGFSGQKEYYCYMHYNEIQDMLSDLLEDTIRCEKDGCTKEGTYAIEGFSGETEYYCYTHYNDIQEMIDSLFNEPMYGNCDNCGRPAQYEWDENTVYCESCFESLLNYILNN